MFLLGLDRVVTDECPCTEKEVGRWEMLDNLEENDERERERER